jgi:acyl-CoA synthetase (NDP forming)
MVPTGEVVRVLEEAADVGVRSAVVLTAGFGEAGPEGRALEERVVALARERDMVLLGPNGNGFINAADQVAPYGLPIAPPLQRGPLGIVLQSGGLASFVLHMASSRNIGVSRLVATGNEAMVTATDVLGYLVADERTAAIAAFLESIREPERFREAAAAALEAGKPIVVLSVGRSAASRPRWPTPARSPATCPSCARRSARPAWCRWTRWRTCSSRRACSRTSGGRWAGGSPRSPRPAARAT